MNSRPDMKMSLNTPLSCHLERMASTVSTIFCLVILPRPHSSLFRELARVKNMRGSSYGKKRPWSADCCSSRRWTSGRVLLEQLMTVS